MNIQNMTTKTQNGVANNLKKFFRKSIFQLLIN